MRRLFPLAALLLLTGCYNGDVNNIRFGDVSLGQQLMDLNSARNTGAMSEDEYQKARAALLALSDACGSLDTGDED